MNLAGIKIGLQPILMIVPVFNEETKSCAFLENEKCVLHDKGLKPLEGKLASCEQDFRMTKETELIFESWIPLQKTLIEKFSKKSYR